MTVPSAAPPGPLSLTAVFSGTFDPPGLWHRHAVETLAAHSDEVVVVACNAPVCTPHDIPPLHRATMADLAFRGIDRVRVDLSDLEQERVPDFAALDARLQSPGRTVTHAMPASLFRGAAKGQSKLHARPGGAEFWATGHFTVLTERHEPLDPADLPPHHRLLDVAPGLPSATIRTLLFEADGAADHLPPAVYAYVARHGLYSPARPRMPTKFRLPGNRLRVFADEWNDTSKNYAQLLRPFASPEPDVVVAIGGDGTMLRAIRQCWRERVPFYGINTGGLGFLLSGREMQAFWERELLLYQLPLLFVETEGPDGTRTEHLAFNDTWVERATGQTAWVKLSVNGEVRVPRLVGDGVLVSTAAGSTSYARAMGAMPMPLNADVLVLAGSNVLKPTFWRPAVLPLDSVVEMETVDPVRRPLHAFIDGMSHGTVRKLTVRVSRTAAAELAFTSDHDPMNKLGFVQFPGAGADL